MGCNNTSKSPQVPLKYAAHSAPAPTTGKLPKNIVNLETPVGRGNLTSVACLRQEPHNFACGIGTQLYCYQRGKPGIILNCQPHDKAISKIRYMSESLLLSSSYDKTIKMWNLGDTSAPVKIFEGHEMSVPTFCFSPEKTILCSGSKDQHIYIWDIAEGRKTGERMVPRNIITCMEWIPTSPYCFVQGSEDCTLRIWDTREFKPQVNLRLQDDYFACTCDITGSGEQLVTGHFDCNSEGCGVILWDLRKIAEGSYLWRYLGHTESIAQVKFLHTATNSDLVVSASKDGTVKIIQNGTKMSEYIDSANWPYTALDVMPEPQVIVSGLCKNSESRINVYKLQEDLSLTMEAATS